MAVYFDGVKSNSLNTTSLLLSGSGGTVNQFPTTDGAGLLTWTSPTPLTQVIYVSASGDDTNGNGSIGWPYATIQHALDQVPAATDSASARKNYVIIVPAGAYDEELTVDVGRKKITLVCDTGVSIGTFASSNWAPSGTARNINITCSLTNIDSIRTSFAIVSRASGQSISTHQIYGNSVRVSGTINISNSTGGSSGEFAFKGVSAFGWDGVAAGNAASFATASWAGNCNVYFDCVRCYGAITGSTVRLQRAVNCRFEKAIALATYSQLCNSEIQAGMTWTVAASEVPPIGVYGCTLAGSFSAQNLYVDDPSRYSYQANAATGAVIVSLQPSPLYALTGDYTIPSTGFAKCYVGAPSGADWTITLPTLSATTYGQELTFINQSATNALIVQRGGTDHIFNGSTTSVTLANQYDRLRITAGNAASPIWFAT
jgi:hypothetical protein